MLLLLKENQGTGAEPPNLQGTYVLPKYLVNVIWHRAAGLGVRFPEKEAAPEEV